MKAQTLRNKKKIDIIYDDGMRWPLENPYFK